MHKEQRPLFDSQADSEDHARRHPNEPDPSGADPLKGSGFEDETAEPDFQEAE